MIPDKFGLFSNQWLHMMKAYVFAPDGTHAYVDVDHAHLSHVQGSQLRDSAVMNAMSLQLV